MLVNAAVEPGPAPVRFVLQWGRRYALTMANVGLACCAVEFVAASMSGSPLLQRTLADGAGTTELLVISGTVTDRLAPAVRRLYEAMPEPRYVLSFGACANSGGPYWDSYCVTRGIDTVIPVDVYVPGCPPRPDALLEGLRTLQRQIDGEAGATGADVRDLRR